MHYNFYFVLLEIFSYFYYEQFHYLVRFICQYDAGHYLIHIITGFIICIIISITPTITDLVLLILAFRIFLRLELVSHFYKHSFLQFYLAIYLNVSNKSGPIRKSSEQRCANNIIVIIFVRPSPWAVYLRHYLH